VVLLRDLHFIRNNILNVLIMLNNATALACHGFETYESEYKTEHGIANRPYSKGYKKYKEETDILPGRPRLL
jgi:hypothetical protein